MYEQAALINRNHKKATSFALNKVDHHGNLLESGNTFEDAWAFVLHEMYKEEKKIKNTGTLLTDGHDDDDDKMNSSLGRDWKFPGWIAFLAWGPFVPPKDRLRVFVTTDNSTLKQSRKDQREKKLMNKKITRGTSAEDRGLTTDQQINLAQISMMKKIYREVSSRIH